MAHAMTARLDKRRMHIDAGHASSSGTTAKPIYTSELPELSSSWTAKVETKSACGVQEDASVRRASGVASTSARQAVGLDACLQVRTACAPTHALVPHLFLGLKQQ